MRILLIEDDEAIGGALRDHASADGHAVDWARGIGEASDFAAVAAYGLVLLDLTLPDGDGRAFLRALRERADSTPVIVLTARDQVADRIAGLNDGADDYLVKPFDLGELSARIHAVARRARHKATPFVRVGDLRIMPADRLVVGEGGQVALTAREWAVLDCLIARPGNVVAKDRIEEALYAFGSEIESNTVEVYVSRLRRKIGREAITTERGLGYRLNAA